MNALAELLHIDRAGDVLVAFIPRMALAALILAGFWVLQRATRPPLRGALRRTSMDEALVAILADNIYKMALFAFALIMAAAQLGVDVTAALAGISVTGLAIGFAAQESLANMIAGFLIFWDKPFLVGDFISVQGQYGRVVEITLRSTRVRTMENTYVVLPNQQIINDVLVNHTKNGEVRVNVPIGIAYKESIPEARRVLLEAVRSLPGVVTTPEPDVVSVELADSSVNLHVRVWVDEPDQERPVFARVLEVSKLALDAAGIQIPYPHLQLFVEQVEDRVWQRLAVTRTPEEDTHGTRAEH
jgi:small conductance mechanosensitive channel